MLGAESFRRKWRSESASEEDCSERASVAEAFRRAPATRAAVSLLSWLMRQGKVAHNPLAVVEKVATHGEKLVRRRAYTAEELVRLLAIAGPRRITYLTRYGAE